MNRFIIVDGLPYLYANGKAYKVRWNEEGFTVGAEVELASVPSVTYSELSIMAKCADNLDSIAEAEQQGETPEGEKEAEQQGETPEGEKEAEQQGETPEGEQPEGEQPNFDEMKLADLKEYAKAHEIDLKGARTKAEIIEAINKSIEK